MPLEDIIDFTRNFLGSRLPNSLTYHQLAHTEDVVCQTQRLCTLYGVNNSEDYSRLMLAAWWHDAGYTTGYHHHEKSSCMLAKEFLPAFGVTPEDLEVISGMIMATKIPQRPMNFLEEILCDADLDYLGRDDFEKQANQLRNEWLNYQIIAHPDDFDAIQLRFLETHRYFTPDSIQRRAPKKAAYLNKLKAA